MDIIGLRDIVMADVKKSINEKYHSYDNNTSWYTALDENGSEVQISSLLFSASVTSFNSFTKYQFLKALGETFTYYKFQANQNGGLNIIQGRCVRSDDDKFLVMAKAATIEGYSEDIFRVISPRLNSFCGITIEDTINFLEIYQGHLTYVSDPEYVFDVHGQDIFTSMEEAVKTCEQKLSDNPSR